MKTGDPTRCPYKSKNPGGGEAGSEKCQDFKKRKTDSVFILVEAKEKIDIFR